MKKIFLALILVLGMIQCPAFAEEQREEFSDDADDVWYEYDEDYDEGLDYEEAEEEPEPEYEYYDDYEEGYHDYDDIDYDDIYYDDTYEDKEDDSIWVFVNDERVYFDVEPIIINNRTMVPMRAIFEALGAEVEWDDNTSTAIGELDGITVEITIGDDCLYRNGRRKSLDSPAIIVSDRTLVPVRAIAESFDCDVEWDGDNMVVDIYY